MHQLCQTVHVSHVVCVGGHPPKLEMTLGHDVEGEAKHDYEVGHQ
jgi:hypothetical protein